MFDEITEQGKKHQSTIRTGVVKQNPPENPELGKCIYCDVVYTSDQQKKAHLAGKKHQKKVNPSHPPKPRSHFGGDKVRVRSRHV